MIEILKFAKNLGSRQPTKEATKLRTDTRGSLRKAFSAVLGIAIIASIGFLLFGGVLIGGGETSTEEGDTDTGPSDGVENETQPGEEEVDEPESDEGDDDESDTDSDDQEQETDDTQNETEEQEETETPTTSVPVSVEAYDLGAVEEGEMTLYNTTSDERVGTHNFEDGHEYTFEELTNETTYQLETEIPQYPAATERFTPEETGEVNKTVGYEFQGAESYKLDWEVDSIPNNLEWDSWEEAKERSYLQDGETAVAKDGNFYTTWEDEDIDVPTSYFYFAENNQSYRDLHLGDGWEQINSHWGNPSNTRDKAVQDGLAGVEDRKFVEQKEVPDSEYDNVHVYDVPESAFDAPMIVHVDPSSGYVVHTEAQPEQMSDPSATRAVADFTSHDQDFDIVPDDFPIEDVES